MQSDCNVVLLLVRLSAVRKENLYLHHRCTKYKWFEKHAPQFVFNWLFFSWAFYLNVHRIGCGETFNSNNSNFIHNFPYICLKLMSIFTFSLFMQNIFSLWLINLLIFHNLLILMHHRPAAGSSFNLSCEPSMKYFQIQTWFLSNLRGQSKLPLALFSTHTKVK